MDFEQFWTAFRPDVIYQNRYEATRKAWGQCPPEKQKAIMRWLEVHGAYQGRNPYFFLQDFQVTAAEPENWNGKALKDGVQYVTAKYNGKWGTYTMEDVIQFKMETKNDQ